MKNIEEEESEMFLKFYKSIRLYLQTEKYLISDINLTLKVRSHGAAAAVIFLCFSLHCC